MFKKILLVCLLVLGIGIGGAGATDFYAKYDKEAECFMSLDYTLYQGAAPNVWVVKYNKPMFERKYLREGGDIWRNAGVQQEEALPCGTAKTAIPAWFCPEPAPVVLAAVTPPPVFEPKTFVVYFDFDKDIIRADQEDVLKEAAEYAAANGEAFVELKAFCDFRGTNDYNVGLGERRAVAVEHWLIENGTAAERFDVYNFGEDESPVRQLAGKFCKDCWSDRRVEITITDE
jgi:outer membrane protein OmpA-like peptidoglycan-associated protein